MKRIVFLAIMMMAVLSCTKSKVDNLSDTEGVKSNRVYNDSISRISENNLTSNVNLSKDEILKLDRIEQMTYLSERYEELKFLKLAKLSEVQYKEIRDLYLDGIFDEKPLCMACIEHNALMEHNYPEEYLRTGYFKEHFPKYKGKNFSVILSIYCPVLCN